MTFKKVLILSASAGAGHMRAADAVERAFRLMDAAADVRHVDTLQYTNKLFRHLYSKAYIDLVNKSPELLGWFYDHLDKPWKNERRRLALDKLNTRPFVKMLEEYQPDITVCTHFLPAEIISWLKAKKRVGFRQAIVVTDFDVHAMWLCHHYEQYFVAMDETREHLVRAGDTRREGRRPPASPSTRSSPSAKTSLRCARSTASGPRSRPSLFRRAASASAPSSTCWNR